MGDRIDVDYEKLENLAGWLGSEAGAVRQLLTETRRRSEDLNNGGWIGRGSDAFFAEMNNRLLPGMHRLGLALDVAADAARQISRTFRQAEKEASALLKQE